jgi:hypothetical protein
VNRITRLRRSYHTEKKRNGGFGSQVSEAEMLLAILGMIRGMRRAECCSGENVQGGTDPVDGRNRLRIMLARRSVELTCFSS